MLEWRPILSGPTSNDDGQRVRARSVERTALPVILNPVNGRQNIYDIHMILLVIVLYFVSFFK